MDISKKSNEQYLQDLATILEPSILDLISLYLDSEIWKTHYSNLLPEEFSELGYVNACRADGEKIKLEYPWTEVYRLAQCIDDTIIIPYILSKRDRTQTGDTVVFKTLLTNIDKMGYLQAQQLTDILTSKLEYQIFKMLLIPDSLNIIVINELWEFLVPEDLDDMDITLISSKEISDTVNVFGDTLISGTTGTTMRLRSKKEEQKAFKLELDDYVSGVTIVN